MEKSNPSEKEIFVGALQLSTPAERATYLTTKCGEDAGLRRRIEGLLEAHEQASEFLKVPAAGVTSKTLLITAGMLAVTEKPGDKIGRYKLREQIGEGGCGVVYVAEQEEPVRRHVALKVIKLGMDTKQVVARFEAERQALALMDHPHIAKVLDAGATATGRPYFVMELVRGIKITDYCDKNNLSTEERLKLFIQVCSAIQHAHQKGIIHRDIKPSNILVTLHDGVPVPKVIDFGIAKATTDQRLTDKTVYTAFEQFLGTPAYMSPEQAEMSGLDIDTRSDIYSLGVLLYELLTGRTPFDAATLLKAGLDQMRRIIREQEPQRPSTRLSTLEDADLTAVANHRHAEPPKLLNLIRGDLDWIVMKALEKDRTRRFETVNALALDLGRHLDKQPVIARPPSNLYRFRKLVLRNQLAFSAATAFTLLLLVGVMGISWQAVRATKAERDQNRLREKAERETRRAEAERSEAQSQTENARKEKSRADEQTVITFETLQQIKIQRAEDMFKSDNTSLALATLAQVLRQNPDNQVAEKRIISALTHRNFLLPRFQLPGTNQVAEFSPDGRWLATAGKEHGLEIRDAQTGRVLVGPVTLTNQVKAIEFNAEGDQLLITYSNQVSIWNAAKLTLVKQSVVFPEAIHSAHFTPFGTKVILAQGPAVSILDADDGRILVGPLVPGGSSRSVYIAAFSRDGTRLLVADGNSGIRIWNATNGIPITDFLDLGGAGPHVALSPDGNSFVVGSYGSTAGCVFDTTTGSTKQFTLRHHYNIPCVDFSPDGKKVVTGCGDGIGRIWEAATGKLITDAIHHDGVIHAIQFDPTGKRLVTFSTDWTFRLWDTDQGRPLSEPLRYEAYPQQFRISPDGLSLLIVSETDAQVWDIRPGQAVAEQDLDSAGSDEGNTSPDGKVVVKLEGHYNGGPTRARIMDRLSMKPIGKTLYFGANVFCKEFSPDSQRIAFGVGRVNGDAKGRAEVFDTKTGSKLMELSVEGWAVLSVGFSPDGHRIATGSKWGEARIWDAQSGKPTTDPLSVGADIQQVLFSPNNTLLLTRADARTAQVWNTINGAQLFKLRHNGNINAAQFSRDGRIIVTAGDDRAARIWETTSGRLLQDLRHESPVRSVSISLDGRLVGTGTKDSVARVWDAGTGCLIGDRLVLPRPAEFGIYRLRFEDDAKRLRLEAGAQVFGFDLPDASARAPSWLADLAEVVGGQRLGDKSQVESVPSLRLLEFKARVESETDSSRNTISQWANWFFAERGKRNISPNSRVSFRDYLGQCASAEDLESYDFEVVEQFAASESELRQLVSKVSERRAHLREADTLSKKARSLAEQEDLIGAEAACRKCLAIRRKVLPNGDRESANMAGLLADLLSRNADGLLEAESLYREALTIRKRFLGSQRINFELAGTFDSLALVLVGESKYAEAETALRECVRLVIDGVENPGRAPTDSWFEDVIPNLAFVVRQQGKSAETEALYREIMEGGSEEWMNNLAWRLATSSDAKLRDGAGAVVLAQKAVELTHRKEPNYVDTLAAAHAEAGQFQRAADVQKEAIALLKTDKENEDFGTRLKLYEANTPYREKK